MQTEQLLSFLFFCRENSNFLTRCHFKYITQKSSFKLSFLPSKKLLQRLTNQVSESCKCEIFDQIETYLD